MPAVAAQCGQLAEQVRERRTHLGFLERCFKLNLEERERWLVERRLHEAHPPRLKTLEEVRLRQRRTLEKPEAGNLEELPIN